MAKPHPCNAPCPVLLAIAAKRCAACHVVLPRGQFNTRTRARDGLRPECRSCQRKYHAKNRDHLNERSRAHWAANRDQYVARSRAYYAANRDQFSEYNREYREANRDRIKATGRIYQSRRRAAVSQSLCGSFTPCEWWEMLEGCDFRCVVCYSPFEIEIGHLVPIVRGGCNGAHNIAPLCRDCNRGRGGQHTRDFWEWLPERLVQIEQEHLCASPSH